MREVGERAWLLSWTDSDEEAANRRAVAAWRRLLRAPPAGLLDAVPAARSLLVRGDARLDPRPLAALEAAAAKGRPKAAGSGRRHEIPIVPGGADLAEVLERTGLDTERFWRKFLGARLRVGFVGFAPGFPYLYGLPEELRLPRRSSPREAVPAGSVALAGPYAGVYPSTLPGGWNLVGTTSVRLFDPGAVPPALLAPGDEVVFTRSS